MCVYSKLFVTPMQFVVKGLITFLSFVFGICMFLYLSCRPYSCPCPGASCKWQGALEYVMSHLTEQHKSITTLQGQWGQTPSMLHSQQSESLKRSTVIPPEEDTWPTVFIICDPS